MTFAADRQAIRSDRADGELPARRTRLTSTIYSQPQQVAGNAPATIFSTECGKPWNKDSRKKHFTDAVGAA